MPDRDIAEADTIATITEVNEQDEDDAEMERLFSKKPRRKVTKQRQPQGAADLDAKMVSMDAKTTRSGDADLSEALELIAGKAPRRVRKKRRLAGAIKDVTIGNVGVDDDEDVD